MKYSLSPFILIILILENDNVGFEVTDIRCGFLLRPFETVSQKCHW